MEGVAGRGGWGKWKMEELCVYCGRWWGGEVRVSSWVEERGVRVFEWGQGR